MYLVIVSEFKLKKVNWLEREREREREREKDRQTDRQSI